MKKFIYLFMVLGLGFTACDPMEDVYDELNLQEEIITGEAEFALSDEDYDDLGLNYGNFSSIDDAKTMIPGLLEEKYPVWGDGALANVSFNLYDPIVVEDYTVSSSDYDDLIDMGKIQGAHLSSIYDINDFFTYKYSQSDEGSYVNLTYNKLSEKITYTLTDDDYDLVGNGNYDNFDIRTGKGEEDIEVRKTKIETILLENFPDTPVNQQYLVSYAAFNNSYDNVVLEMLLEFDGTNYNMVSGIEYVLTDDDFTLIGAELGTKYPDPAYSAGNYKNFDRRIGRDGYWSDDMIIEALNIVLQILDPTAVDGTRYSVDMSIYDGSSGTLTMLVELNGGSYGRIPDSLIEETTIFALTNDYWDVLFALTSDDYTEMGQNYPNFSDEDLAWYRIAILLETKYPYAEAEEMIAVSYNLYNSGVTTKYVNFVFDGNVWGAIPSVVEKVIQFGHDGTSWLPDNTINYTLTAADYDLVGNGNYGNFDVRAGKAEETVEARLAKINTILLNNFPAAAEGQKYSVFYNVYSGTAEVWNMKVIKVGSEYVLQ